VLKHVRSQVLYKLNVNMCLCPCVNAWKTRENAWEGRGGGGGDDNIIRMLRDGVAYTQLSTQITSLFG